MTHAGFVLSAYAAAALVLGGLVLRAVLTARSARQRLAELESRGIRRRSAP